MSTLNKINWRDSNTTLTRENLAKMADDINVISQTSGGNVDHYLDTLGNRTDTTIRNLQEGVCEKNTLVFDSNTAVLTNKLSTEVYTIDKENLCTKGGTSGSFANYFNPLPAGIYAMYLWNYGSTTFTKQSTITITARYNKKSKNATDVDNRIMVVNKTVNPKQAFTFEAPNGIDFISITTPNTGSYQPVIVRVDSLTESISIIDRSPASKGTTNLMPFPFQYDYVKSGITSFDYNVDGFPCKGGLKFKHLTNGALQITRAPNYNTSTGTSEAVSFYLHNGTEVRLPKGTYTFGCRSYQNQASIQDGVSRLRILARWDDGDSSSYYPETLNNGEMGKAKPVGYNAPLTVNATHGINSITAFIYIPAGSIWPADGLTYVPVLVSGTDVNQLLGSYFYDSTSFSRNIVYRYSNNLLISRSPKIYNNNVNGTGLGTSGTTKDGLPYAESNGISIMQVASGHYILNGTATADTEFQICPGYTFMDPIGTFKFGGIPSTVDSKVSFITRIRYLTSDNSYHSISNVTATPGVDGTITSTRDKRMCAYYNARIKIQAGAVCNNDLISWYIKPEETSTVDRYRMPVASAGECPMFFDYYKASDSIYIGNPNYNIAVNALSKGTGGALPAAEEVLF